MNTQIPMPIIHQYRCTGCGTCVATCPVDALASRNGKAELANPEACTYCVLCEDICPEGAISLPFVVVFEEQRESGAG